MKTKITDISKDEILDWIADHELLTEDFKIHFDVETLECCNENKAATVDISVEEWGNDYYCSECGSAIDADDDWAYCPHCGLKLIYPDDAKEAYDEWKAELKIAEMRDNNEY